MIISDRTVCQRQVNIAALVLQWEEELEACQLVQLCQVT